MPDRPVLILGAGVNGCATARELAVNGVGVWLVDCADVASGATSRTSHLIHGGLRYLEYGDVRLVRESLAERSRLLRLAPQFVTPLRLYIPVRRRTGGLFRSWCLFCGLTRFRLGRRVNAWLSKKFTRGQWAVRVGLWLYDRLAGDGALPGHQCCALPAPAGPKVDSERYRWMCSYSDAQMRAPERFVIALLDDARKAAAEQGVDFRVFTYHHVALRGSTAEIRRSGDSEPVETLSPAAILNATGAWGDFTLKDLNIPADRMFGGTKGSHFITRQPEVRRRLDGDGVYAESPDGRLIFILPFENSVLVGTTDERFTQSPEKAVASRHELDYLIRAVNWVFGDVTVTDADVEMHYCGVRPLPYTEGNSTASIPRGHWIEPHPSAPVPTYTLIGGKLTTCRSFAEHVADVLFERLSIKRRGSTRNRVIPGGRDWPSTDASRQEIIDRAVRDYSLTVAEAEAVWSLCGNRFEEIFSWAADSHAGSLASTNLPVSFVRWCIQNEWVSRLDDLVERRLLLLYESGVDRACLRHLAELLVEAGMLEASCRERAVDECIERLKQVYGKTVRE